MLRRCRILACHPNSSSLRESIGCFFWKVIKRGHFSNESEPVLWKSRKRCIRGAVNPQMRLGDQFSWNKEAFYLAALGIAFKYRPAKVKNVGQFGPGV